MAGQPVYLLIFLIPSLRLELWTLVGYNKIPLRVNASVYAGLRTIYMCKFSASVVNLKFFHTHLRAYPEISSH
jgi:hypothetical protein